MEDASPTPTDRDRGPTGLTVHASCVARDGRGVLLLGHSGAGKSDLALRLLQHGFRLVSDDRVLLQDGTASPPEALAGLLEVRGIGILRVEPAFPARLALAVTLDEGVGERLPDPATHPMFGVPWLRLASWHVSAPLKVAIALDCVLGKRILQTGFVAPTTQQTHDGYVAET